MTNFLRQTTNRTYTRLIFNKLYFRFNTESPLWRKASRLAEFKQFRQQSITNPEFISKCPTFHQQVLSCVLSPELIGGSTVSYDASKRAQIYLNQIKSVGAYSTPLGTPSVRKNIGKYISRTCIIDEPSIQNVILMPGSIHAMDMIMKCLIVQSKDSIMLPVPWYPTYSHIIQLAGGHISPYYLNEAHDWKVDLDELERSFDQAVKSGKKVKALVVINPGNPTGTIISQSVLQQFVKFAHKHKLPIIADEVNSDFVYDSSQPFLPIIKVIKQMDGNYLKQCEVISLYSNQKTPLGTLGVQAAYLHCHNIESEIPEQFLKLWNIYYSSNVCGQIALDLLRTPFLYDVNESIRQQYFREKNDLFNYMKRRAEIVEKHFAEMQNVKMSSIQAGNYGYAQIKLLRKVIDEAKSIGLSGDEYFCQQVMKNLNLSLVSGKYHENKPNTHSFKINILNEKEDDLSKKLQQLKQFVKSFNQKYKN